jgi:pyruvate formate lyase activating enzyme
MDSSERLGYVHSWDTSIGVDGPGTRLVFFLAGCPLRCIYCENPDTWCAHTGQEMRIEEADRLLDRFGTFISVAGGGVTLSGGEPLAQASFTCAVFEHAKARGLHTALDTSGFLGHRAGDRLLDATDLVLLDIKAGTDGMHRRITGRSLGPTLVFAHRLAERNARVWVRYVLVPGYTDDFDEVDRVAETIVALGNVERIDVLPFHKLGAAKYDALGIPFPLADNPVPTPELVESVRARFEAFNLVAA